MQNGPEREHARIPDHPTVVGPVPPSRPHPPPSPTGARRSQERRRRSSTSTQILSRHGRFFRILVRITFPSGYETD